MRVTIITVCLNSEKTIKDTIKSVLEQNYSDVEYIIVDGQSEDDTLQIIKSYGSEIDKVISEKDKGIYFAMNKGLQHATGDIIGFINADDFYADENVLTQVVESMRFHDVAICYGNLNYVGCDNVDKNIRIIEPGEFRKGFFSRGWCPPHPTFFVNKKIYDALGIFDTQFNIASDVELMMRFLEKYEIKSYYLPVLLVKMRIGGVTNRSAKNICKQNAEIFKAMKKNNIPFSYIAFITFKIFSRCKQYLTTMKNHH